MEFSLYSLLLFHADVFISNWRAQRVGFVQSPYKSYSLLKMHENQRRVSEKRHYWYDYGVRFAFYSFRFLFFSLRLFRLKMFSRNFFFPIFECLGAA
jgi:hypothetical protein